MEKEKTKNWIVCMGGEDWWYHTHAHFDIQVMKCLSERTPVLYICSVGMRMPSLTKDKMFWTRVWRKLKSVSHTLQKITPQLYVFSPLPLPLYQHSLGRMFNSMLLRLQFFFVYKRLGIKAPLIWVNTPTGWPIIESWPKSGLVYQRTDDYAAYDFDNFNAEYIRKIDNQLLREANLSIHVSDELHAEAQEMTPNSILVPQGVDSRFFQFNGPSPPDLDRLKGPVIGYVGGMDSHKFDTQLVAEVVRNLPEYSFALVGVSSPNVEELKGFPNVHFLGTKTHDEIPAYIHNFDICMLPTAQTEWGLKCRPLKLMEYLAACKPVVATPTPASVPFASIVKIGADSRAWVAAITLITARQQAQDADESAGVTQPLKPWSTLADDLWQQLVSKNVM
jgi:glycosyltransferase involved in cell wall biosynthesis